MKAILQQMHNSDNFADVTLICDDKIQIKAHRHVLSVCSPVFKNLFTDEIDNHPVILLPGIQYSEMQTIMQFMYLGEAKCFDESMNQLLSAAKSLDIQEFANSVVIKLDPENENNHNKAQSKDMNLLPESKHVPNNNETCNQCGYQARLPKALKYHIQSKHQVLRHACLQCGQQLTTKSSLKKHIKLVHDNHVMLDCQECDYETKHMSKLASHIQTKHVKYNCNQCEYQATQKCLLKKHIKYKHEGAKQYCNECDYQASNPSSIILHIQTKHKGITYSCDHCDYETVYNSTLKKHVESKHEGLRHTCLQCGQQLTTKSGLNNHVKAVHESLNKCEVCNIEYSSKSVLIRHIKSGHKYGRNNRKL